MLLAKDLLFIKIYQILYKALIILYKILILVILLNPTKIKVIKSEIRGYKSFILLERG